jgi:hypothetical protein
MPYLPPPKRIFHIEIYLHYIIGQLYIVMDFLLTQPEYQNNNSYRPVYIEQSLGNWLIRDYYLYETLLSYQK